MERSMHPMRLINAVLGHEGAHISVDVFDFQSGGEGNRGVRCMHGPSICPSPAEHECVLPDESRSRKWSPRDLHRKGMSVNQEPRQLT